MPQPPSYDIQVNFSGNDLQRMLDDGFRPPQYVIDAVEKGTLISSEEHILRGKAKETGEGVIHSKNESIVISSDDHFALHIKSPVPEGRNPPAATPWKNAKEASDFISHLVDKEPMLLKDTRKGYEAYLPLYDAIDERLTKEYAPLIENAVGRGSTGLDKLLDKREARRHDLIRREFGAQVPGLKRELLSDIMEHHKYPHAKGPDLLVVPAQTAAAPITEQPGDRAAVSRLIAQGAAMVKTAEEKAAAMLAKSLPPATPEDLASLSKAMIDAQAALAQDTASTANRRKFEEAKQQFLGAAAGAGRNSAPAKSANVEAAAEMFKKAVEPLQSRGSTPAAPKVAENPFSKLNRMCNDGQLVISREGGVPVLSIVKQEGSGARIETFMPGHSGQPDFSDVTPQSVAEACSGLVGRANVNPNPAGRRK